MSSGSIALPVGGETRSTTAEALPWVPGRAGAEIPHRKSGPRNAAGHPINEVRGPVGSVIKKRRKRMAKKKHRKLLRKTRHQRRNKK